MKINRNTTCNKSNKDCNIMLSKQPSLKAMNLMYCAKHTEVISYEQTDTDES